MSVHIKCLQGGTEWFMARMGLPTASEFHKILTPKKLEVSTAGVKTMAAEIVAERAMMQPLEVDLAGFAERGDILEREAVPYYSMQKDVDVSRDGFYFDPALMIGASPDGITPDAGLEVKSLSPAKHLRFLMGEYPADYMAQVQACMWLCGRERWDLLFYHPTLPSKILSIAKDPAYIGRLETAITAVNVAIREMVEKLEAAGVSFAKWWEHAERLGRGEVPTGTIQRPKRFDLWSGDVG